MQVFRVVWINESQIAVDTEEELILFKDRERALASIGLRCYQSTHKIPEDAYGFLIIPVDSVLNE